MVWYDNYQIMICKCESNIKDKKTLKDNANVTVYNATVYNCSATDF